MNIFKCPFSGICSVNYCLYRGSENCASSVMHSEDCIEEDVKEYKLRRKKAEHEVLQGRGTPLCRVPDMAESNSNRSEFTKEDEKVYWNDINK